jgi:hypothetical protein
MEASARKRGDAVVSVIYHMAANDAAIVERMEKAWPLQMTAIYSVAQILDFLLICRSAL